MQLPSCICNVHVMASPPMAVMSPASSCMRGGTNSIPTCRRVWHSPCSSLQTNSVVNPMAMQLMATQGLSLSPGHSRLWTLRYVHEPQPGAVHEGCTRGITYPSRLPKQSSEACAVVEEAGKLALDVCTRADGEYDHCEERLEIKERRHRSRGGHIKAIALDPLGHGGLAPDGTCCSQAACSSAERVRPAHHAQIGSSR